MNSHQRLFALPRGFVCQAMALMCVLFAVARMALPKAKSESGGVQKESITYEGRKRTVYFFVPDSLPPQAAAPLIVLLHGSGEDGLSLVNPWHDLALREDIILVAPDAANIMNWDPREDHPNFLRQAVESAGQKHPVDPRRIYVFGHSAGGTYALSLALLEPNYFAAVAVHAAALCSVPGLRQCSQDETDALVARVQRKMPIGMWTGTVDEKVPLDDMMETRDILEGNGFPVELHEMPGRGQNYYEHADEVNEAVWAFLRQHQLDAEPNFQRYNP